MRSSKPVVLVSFTFELTQQVKPEPDVPEACEAERLREDRRAFETLMGYNVDMAYGLDREEE